MITEVESQRWEARPVQAWTIRILAFLFPIAGSIVFVRMASVLVPVPTSAFVLFAGWWLAMSGSATVVLFVLDRMARRLMPLVALYRLSLVFPDAAPSRFKAALRSNDVASLEQRIAGTVDDATPVEAAEHLLSLVEELDAHDHLTRGHAERVRAYAQMIGKELHLSADELDHLNWAALLHDVGKLDMPREILVKPGKPTEQEWTILRSHAELGGKRVEPLSDWLGDSLRAVTEHHENWDGSGYPRGLSEGEIALAARIVAVADVFDVITSARSYKSAFTSPAARDEIARHAGTQFDPQVVRAFLNISLGRLRLVMGPLSWLAHVPALGRMPLTPAIGTVAASVGTVAASLVAGVVATKPPPAIASPLPTQAITRTVERTTNEDEALVVPIGGAAERGAAVTSVKLTGLPVVGRVRVTLANEIVFVPPPDFHGRVRVSYTACFEGLGCARRVLSITVLAVNDPPRAVADSARTGHGQPVAVDVLANDSDPEGDGLTLVSISGAGGAGRIVGNRVRFTPAPSFSGTAVLRYTVADGNGGTATGLVRVVVAAAAAAPKPTAADAPAVPAPVPASEPEPAPAEKPSPKPSPKPKPTPKPVVAPVNRAPVAQPDQATVAEGASVRIDVLANDSDPDGDRIFVASAEAPPAGSARVVDGEIVFTAPGDGAGPISFPYTIVDANGARASAIVTVTILPVNAPPRFTPGGPQGALEDAGPRVVSGWATGIGPGRPSESGQTVTFLVGNDNNGLFSEQPRLDSNGTLRYTPAANASGSASVTVRAKDNGGTANGGRDTSSPHTFTITVTAVNDPPVANPDNPTVAEDTAAGVTFDVLANDTDADNDTLTLASFDGSAIAHGTLTHTGGGSYTYVPTPDFSGTETFTYTVTDGQESVTATVTITVTSVPDDPEAANDAYTTDKNVARVVGAPGVLANDSDHDGDTLTLQTTPVTPPANGTVVLASDGSFTYTPANGFSGTDSFVYRIDDGTGRTADGTVTITVNSAITTSSLYFADTGPLSTIWGMTTTPPAAASPVPDYDGDSKPGLTIKSSDGDDDNEDPREIRAWGYTTSSALVLNGPVTLELWSTIEDFRTGRDGHPYAYLYDCAPGGIVCVKIAQNDVHFNNWNLGTANWMHRSITIGSVDRTIAANRVLKIVLLFKHDDLWVAMTGGYPSGLTLTLG